MRSKQWGLVIGVGCALAFFSVLSAPYAHGADAQTPISFSGVASGQQLLIYYHTVAEGGTDDYSLQYRPAPESQITVIDEGISFYRKRGKHEIGSLSLSPSQIVLLDNLLTYYRKHDRQGGCTTQHFVTLSLMEGNTLIRKESYVDSTCAIEITASATPAQRKELNLADAPLLSFDDIIDSINQKNEPVKPSNTPSPFGPEDEGSAADRAVYELRAEKAEKLLCQQTLTHLPGHDELTKRFFVRYSHIGGINDFSNVFHLALETKQPRLVNSIWWFDPLKLNHPQYDAYQLLNAYRRATNAVDANHWLREWKNAGPGRSIELEAYGDQANTLNGSAYDDGLHAWRDAHLRGRPDYEFFLRRTEGDSQDEWCGTVYLGKSDTHGLITSADPVLPGHGHNWLDRLKVSYSDNDKVPDYVVVARDGRWWRNGRSHLSPK